jgi:GNAT superfamily N-acetyltransferase
MDETLGVLSHAFGGALSSMSSRAAENLRDIQAGRRDQGVAFSALVDGHVAGNIQLDCAFSPEFRLKWLAVDPARQGVGVGTALLAHADGFMADSLAEYGYDHGIVSLSSLVSVQYPESRFFERNGYTIVWQPEPVRDAVQPPLMVKAVVPRPARWAGG